jgi:hypothetical protein
VKAEKFVSEGVGKEGEREAHFTCAIPKVGTYAGNWELELQADR